MSITIKLFIISLVIFLLGCSSALHIKINSAHHLNPDRLSHSLPVQVVIYQLRDDQEFKQATFQALWRHDKATLGSSLLAHREVNVVPHSSFALNILAKKEVMYVGVMAIFRNPNQGHWRAIKKIGVRLPFFYKTVTLTLDGNRIMLH